MKVRGRAQVTADWQERWTAEPGRQSASAPSAGTEVPVKFSENLGAEIESRIAVEGLESMEVQYGGLLRLSDRVPSISSGSIPDLDDTAIEQIRTAAASSDEGSLARVASAVAEFNAGQRNMPTTALTELDAALNALTAAEAGNAPPAKVEAAEKVVLEAYEAYKEAPVRPGSKRSQIPE